MNMIFERKLPIPMEVKELYPLSYDLEQIVKNRKKEIEDIFTGKSDKLALIIGPCSAPRQRISMAALSSTSRILCPKTGIS